MRGLLIAAAALFSAGTAADEEAPVQTEAAVAVPAAPLRVTGSSTVTPYALVATSLAAGGDVFVEATGTGAGLAALCGAEAAPLAGASRPIAAAELDGCAAFGIATVIEAEIGLGAISLVQSASSGPLALTLTDLYLASAARVPDAGCRLVPNKARRWSDVREELPDRPIRLYGPPATSGTRDVLSDQGLAVGARRLPCLAALEARDADAFAEALGLRRDGAWIDGGESDGALAYALTRLPDAVGLVGRVHALAQEGLAQLSVDGVSATSETIADGTYPLARPLYLYTTADALTADPRVRPVLLASTADAAGGDGPLSGMGLVARDGGARVRLISTANGTATPLPLGRR